MLISLGNARVEGEWASFNELCGYGDGVKTQFETPFNAEDARGLHVMRDLVIIDPAGINRVLNPDGSLLRDEPDGYTLSTEPEKPVTITFDRAPRLKARISCSVFGRKPEKGIAFKVLPITDNLSKKIDDKTPADMKKRKREDLVQMAGLMVMYKEAFVQLVDDWSGFVGDDKQPLQIGVEAKNAVVNKLGALVLGMWAIDRARVLQAERISDTEHDREG